MKKIIYITTTMNEEDYVDYMEYWKIKPNPSNQNFHNKFIRSLAINNFVDVISIRPFSRNLCSLKRLPKDIKIENNITWHYLSIARNVFIRINSCLRQIYQLINEIADKNTIIFTDTINMSIVYYLKHVLKKKKIRVVGLLTDSPSNISNTRKSYTTFILNNTNQYDAYIALTRELNDLYNTNNKPYLVNEGIVEEKHTFKKDKLAIKYFFFAGAIMERYGIYNLIEAFKKINIKYPNYYLLIAGHHADEQYLFNKIKDCHNIRYLYTLSYDDVLYYEKYAVANINPRPFSEDLDHFSIPSKTLEYSCSGTITISVKNSKLIKYFPQEIVWCKSSNIDDLYEAMEKVITNDDELNKEIATKAKEIVLDNFSLEAVNKKVNDFLEKVFKDEQ